jgi:hypothetical protein
MPKTLVSDNGTNFISNIMKYLCNQWNITQRFTSPYHPQSNLTERANRTIKTMIRAYLDGLPHNKWAQNLSFISLAINNSKQESTGFSPANLMLNRDFNLPFNISVSPVLPSANSVNIQVKSNAEIIFDRKQVYSNILAFVRDNLQKAKAKQKEAYDRAHRDDRFEVGDKVLLRDTTLSSAADGVVAGLMPLYRPEVARVTKVTGDLTYEITFDDGTVKPSVHIQNLRRYHERLVSPSSSTHNVSTDNCLNQIPDSVSPLDNSN